MEGVENSIAPDWKRQSEGAASVANGSSSSFVFAFRVQLGKGGLPSPKVLTVHTAWSMVADS